MILFFSSNILIIMLSKCKKNIDYYNDESAVMGSRVVVWDNLPKTLYVRKHISLNASNRHSQKILCYLFVFFITKSSRNQYLMSYCFSSLTLTVLLPIVYLIIEICIIVYCILIDFYRMMKTYCEHNKQILFWHIATKYFHRNISNTFDVFLILSMQFAAIFALIC